MYKKLNGSIEFRNELMRGLNEYQGLRLETVNLSKSFDNPRDLMKCFENFVDRIGYHKYGHMICQWCIVLVRDQHIHGLIRKPWQPPELIRSIWQNQTGELSNSQIRTLSSDTKQDVIKVKKMVDYFTNQASHHDTYVNYFVSDKWAFVTDEEKQEILIKEEKKKEKQIKEVKKMVKQKFDPVVVIEGKFMYWSQLTIEQQLLFGGRK